MKKFFSLVLALVMALSLTTVAWGAETQVADQAAWDAAIAVAKDGDTLKLAAGTYNLGTLGANAAKNLTIEGTTGTVVTYFGVGGGEYGNVTIKNCTFEVGSVWCGSCIEGKGTFTYENCDFVVAANATSVGSAIYVTAQYADNKYTIKDCSFDGAFGEAAIVIQNSAPGAYEVIVSGNDFSEVQGDSVGVWFKDSTVDLTSDVNTVAMVKTADQFETAVAASEAGDSIKLMADVIVSDVVIDKPITINENGNTLTGMTAGFGVTTDASGKLTSGTFATAPDADSIAPGYSYVNGTIVKNSGTSYENLNGKKANGDVISNKLNLKMVVAAAKAPTYNDDGILTAPGKVESAVVMVDNTQVAGTGTYVLVNSVNDLTNPADIVLYKDAEMKYPAYFLKAVNTPEYAEGVFYNNFGKACGQVNYPNYDAKDVYFTAKGEATGAIFVADEDGDINVMYGGKLVAVEPIGYSVKTDAVDHKPVMVNKNGKTVSVECSACGLDAVQVANVLSLPKGAEQIAGTLSGVWYWPSAAVSAPSTDKVTSAETFDAGIAMYVGMSVLAATGSAVVLKKREH